MKDISIPNCTWDEAELFKVAALAYGVRNAERMMRPVVLVNENEIIVEDKLVYSHKPKLLLYLIIL